MADRAQSLQEHATNAKENFVMRTKRGPVAYNPRPGNEAGAKPVTSPVFDVLQVMYALFTTLDLAEHNAARAAKGEQAHKLVAAVLSVAPDYAPTMVDRPAGSVGYPTEVTPGKYRFAERFFVQSLRRH
ncbi:hypothetical protein EOL96_00280 [Candidatus Saccharibacteria bacterium]|nr:hypothetical protein [Candidatus Saccharibacteria bacterium]